MDKTFVEAIRSAVEMALEDKIVEVKEATKTNGVKYTGIAIRSEESNIAPTIYINESESVEENVIQILKMYKGTENVGDIDMSWFTDYENVKGRLSVKLTSKPNKGIAKRKAPGFDDLYMNAYVIVDDIPGTKGSITIRDEHLKNWGITNARLFADAMKSAPTVTPAVKKGMSQLLVEMGLPPFMVSDAYDIMSVVTNKENVNGAAAILFTEVDEGTYMIPSSVHEVILLNEEDFHTDDVNGIIGMVNDTEVKPEEQLGNHAYRYNGKKWENVA